MGESFGTDDTEGPYGVQMYMVRREIGVLDQVRPLITGDENPRDHWTPGLLALYTELGMSEPASRLLHWMLDRAVRWFRGNGPVAGCSRVHGRGRRGPRGR